MLGKWEVRIMTVFEGVVVPGWLGYVGAAAPVPELHQRGRRLSGADTRSGS